MCFENWDGYVDVYMRVSTWECDMWSHYTINDQSMPEDWHKSNTMTWVSNDLWTMDDLRDKKRKYDEVESDAMTMDAAEEGLLHAAAIYQQAVDAMTPTRIDTVTPSPEREL